MLWLWKDNKQFHLENIRPTHQIPYTKGLSPSRVRNEAILTQTVFSSFAQQKIFHSSYKILLLYVESFGGFVNLMVFHRIRIKVLPKCGFKNYTDFLHEF